MCVWCVHIHVCIFEWVCLWKMQDIQKKRKIIYLLFFHILQSNKNFPSFLSYQSLFLPSPFPGSISHPVSLQERAGLQWYQLNRAKWVSVSLGETLISRLNKATHKRKRKKNQAKEKWTFSISHYLETFNSTKLDKHSVYTEVLVKTHADSLMVVSVSVTSYEPS